MLEKNQDDSYEIDISALFKALWRKIWLILIATVVCGAAFFAYARFRITPKYSASTMLYVNTSSTVSLSSYKFSTSDMSAGTQLVTRYIVILGSRSCLERVKAESGVNYSYSELSGMISASAVEETEIFKVSVTCTNPDEAALIANTIAKVLPERISDIISGTSVEVVDYAISNNNRVSPSYSKYMITGIVVGLLLTSIIIIIIELLDDIIHSDEYLTETYKDIPFLAAIPDLTTKNDRVYYRGSTRKAQLGSYRDSYEYSRMAAAQRSEAESNNGGIDIVNISKDEEEA